MGVIPYMFFSYALTAAISFLIIGIIVLVNKLMSKTKNDENREEEQ